MAMAVIALIGGWLLLRKSDGNTESGLSPERSITHAHGLVVDGADPNRLYIATHRGLLVLINEKDLYRVGKSKDDYMGFSPHPTDPKIFFSSGHPSFGGNIGFQRSDDGGFTWKKVSNGVNGPVDFHAMAVSPLNPDLIYGWYQGNLQRSIDQGRKWEIVNTSIVAQYLSADPRDENTVYAATPQGVLVSRDKGVSWSSLSKDLEGGSVFVVVVNPADTKELLAFSEGLFAFSERLGGLGKSTDGGTTWQRVSESFDGEAVLYIAYTRQQPKIVYAITHNNTLYKSVDGGDTWKKIR